MTSIELQAPAKVNLYLKVLNKRSDSYHNIISIFERISLYDTIKITKIPHGIKLVSDKKITSKVEDNIAYKAARSIFDYAKVSGGVSIKITKRIPIAAGLGGGSSDAATVLMGINKLFNLKISKKRLMKLGAKLGADVPFFILEAPFAIGRGIGDRLEKLNVKHKFSHILIYPGFKVATKDVYQAIDIKPVYARNNTSIYLTRNRPDVKMTFLKNRNNLEDFIYNDLERVVVSIKPIIGKIIKCLASSLLRRAMVSGSGPSVFCLYRNREEAIRDRRKLFRKVPARFRKRWQIFSVDTKI